ncbi:RNA ligase and tail fiber protein attachment cata lyst [Vibrio phage D479]
MKIQKLYDDLMALVESPGKFYCVDHINTSNERLRVFAYHVAQYEDWLKPSALECRGIMFQIDDDGKMIRLVSRPMEKFFNDKENPMTMNIDYKTAVSVMDKVDGSLISTYITGEGDHQTFGLKSKTSISSDQAIAANRYIKLRENRVLFDFVEDCSFMGITVNMEYTAPNNRIVLEYKEPKLTILNMRDNETGDYVDFDTIPNHILNSLQPWLVDEYDASIAFEDDFVESIKAMVGIEGVIVRTPDIQTKIKTSWYVNLHRQKDSVSNPKRLVETVLNNHHDDLYSLFCHDQNTIDRIREFELHVVDKLQRDIANIQRHAAQNRHKSRKDYAIEGKRVTEPHLFGVYMNRYESINQDIYKQLVSVYLRRPELLVPEKYLREM